ncbi:MAG: hypothetical protein QW666_02085 [Candidatus Woesearchaeota archaeon]
MKKQLFLSTLLLIFAFVIGIIVGNSLGNSELKKADRFIRQSELSTESYLLEQEILQGFNQSCDLAQARLSELSSELWQLGKILGTETAKQDLGEENYHTLKLKYHLMQIKTYLLYYKLNRDCKINTPVVLFYYKQNDTASKEQGIILDKFVEKYGIKVFAIEFNYSKELKFLEINYGIDQGPSLVINYKTKKTGLTSYDNIKSVLGVTG